MSLKIRPSRTREGRSESPWSWRTLRCRRRRVDPSASGGASSRSVFLMTEKKYELEVFSPNGGVCVADE